MTSTNASAPQSDDKNKPSTPAAKAETHSTPQSQDANIQNAKPETVSAGTETKREKTVIPEQPIKVLPVDITVSGKVYTINCPADEQDELKAAATYINHFIQDIRKQAPHITHENLLVLSCLNLYEQMQASQKSVNSNGEINKQAHVLVDKMIKDMQMI